MKRVLKIRRKSGMVKQRRPDKADPSNFGAPLHGDKRQGNSPAANRAIRAGKGPRPKNFFTHSVPGLVHVAGKDGWKWLNGRTKVVNHFRSGRECGRQAPVARHRTPEHTQDNARPVSLPKPKIGHGQETARIAQKAVTAILAGFVVKPHLWESDQKVRRISHETLNSGSMDIGDILPRPVRCGLSNVLRPSCRTNAVSKLRSDRPGCVVRIDKRGGRCASTQQRH